MKVFFLTTISFAFTLCCDYTAFKDIFLDDVQFLVQEGRVAEAIAKAKAIQALPAWVEDAYADGNRIATAEILLYDHLSKAKDTGDVDPGLSDFPYFMTIEEAEDCWNDYLEYGITFVETEQRSTLARMSRDEKEGGLHETELGRVFDESKVALMELENLLKEGLRMMRCCPSFFLKYVIDDGSCANPQVYEDLFMDEYQRLIVADESEAAVELARTKGISEAMQRLEETSVVAKSRNDRIRMLRNGQTEFDFKDVFNPIFGNVKEAILAWVYDFYSNTVTLEIEQRQKADIRARLADLQRNLDSPDIEQGWQAHREMVRLTRKMDVMVQFIRMCPQYFVRPETYQSESLQSEENSQNEAK